jgi:hypothetical protein
MAENEAIDRLQRRLRWEAPGPLTEHSNQAAASLFSVLRFVTQRLRQAGEERPLVSLLLAFQAGFAIGHWGARRAKR